MRNSQALHDVAVKGNAVHEGTAHEALELCSHQGRARLCCDTPVQAGIVKTVASATDPNPFVAGHGFERLRAAGVDIEIGPGGPESRELNIGFFSRMIRGTPWVRLKAAASLDGTTALNNGASQWITSHAARADGHAWRARACAVLTGIGTVLDDNPRLDVREVPTPRQPHVVVVDSHLQTPPDAHLFLAERDCYIYTAVENNPKRAALEARGAQVFHLPHASGKVDLAAMLRDLGQRGINELHVEAGHKLNGSLVREGLVDEFLIYLAPRLLGQGFGMAQFGPLETLADGLALEFKSVDTVGPDLRIVARVAGRDRF
jgi:diaminohydroxyphosphoribosylaminopyrimidine deaminase / 5-amino-6-(5-phosphoribosylamino)uracil reductase